ncbi:MAG: asparagine synthase (glutamine-hydrolyzing) [Gammaproteobacteria bacterium]|nr:asparagine synthase (glutamine-hydrolyzing) [Gammaproteobacteria bacterium]
MCGVVGVVSQLSHFDHNAERMQDALKTISHRGPDDFGSQVLDHCAFGHVRLSILDLSKAGHQPMVDCDKEHMITYNGEIYNFKDLKSDLQSKSISFESNSDTEVILQGFKYYGTRLFEMLDGMFAFAITDLGNKKVYLVRDRFGIKPLYYYQKQGLLYFSSEIKAIKAFSGDSIKQDLSVLPEWSYFGATLRENTFYKHVKKLLPGHFLEIDLSSFEIEKKKYWSIERLPRKKTTPETDANVTKTICNLLEQAVVKQLVSDVPVGVSLSGGIDSSAITAFASRHYGKKIKTFSVGFDYDKGVSELPKAKRIAKLFQTEHHEFRISGYDLTDTIEKLVKYHDSPFADAANIPLYLMGQQVKKDVKVVLQGDGGDEFFAGYRRYKTLAKRSYWKHFAPAGVLLNKLLPKNKSYYSRQRYLNALAAKDDAELMALLLTVEDKTYDPLNIFSKETKKCLVGVDPFAAYKESNCRFEEQNIVQKMLYTDTQIILPDIFFEKVDRSTMACGLEVRVPFLDNELTEYILQIPSDQKVKKGVKKRLLKLALEGVLPKEILYGPKTGFGVPYQFWIKGPLREMFYDLVQQLKNNNCDLLNWEYIEQLMKEHLLGERENGFMLWKILNLMVWLLGEK